jgi:hypothetical protein
MHPDLFPPLIARLPVRVAGFCPHMQGGKNYKYAALGFGSYLVQVTAQARGPVIFDDKIVYRISAHACNGCVLHRAQAALQLLPAPAAAPVLPECGLCAAGGSTRCCSCKGAEGPQQLDCAIDAPL